MALLIVQYPLGRLMPHIHHGMKPGDAMTFHVSFGMAILAVMVLRLLWRITHPVAPASSLPAWQQLLSEALHWLLYVARACDHDDGLDLCVRAWVVYLAVLCDPSADVANRRFAPGTSIGNWHGIMEWSLLLLIGAHVGAAMAHTFIFRDRIMQRMLPEKPMTVRTENPGPEVMAMKPAQEARMS